jgi:dynein heavy chain
VWSEADNSNAEVLYVLHTRLHKVQTLITNRTQSLETDIPKYIRKLEQEKELLKVAVKALYTRYQEFIQISISASQNLEKWMTDCAVLAASLMSQINEVEATRKKINYRESVLGMETSKQYLLDKLVASSPVVLQFSLKSAEVHQNLQIWQNTPLNKIDPDNIAASLLTIKAEFITSLPKLASSQQQIATSLCSDFDTFLTYISVANLLKEPSLKERHWKQICTVLELASDSYLDLGAVVTKSGHLPPKLDGIRSIIEIAVREQGIETQLRENQHRFNEMTFKLTQFNDTWLLTGQDFIRGQIVEFRELLRHITEQQCAQELKLRAVEWTKRLDILELLVEEWTKAQDLMLQIHSLFLTPESRSGNFATFSEYQKLISRLTKILVEIQEQPQVLRCREMHIKYFQSCSHQLHVLSSSLSPAQEDDGQFYALSDSQMLQLLSSEE